MVGEEYVCVGTGGNRIPPSWRTWAVSQRRNIRLIGLKMTMTTLRQIVDGQQNQSKPLTGGEQSAVHTGPEKLSDHLSLRDKVYLIESEMLKHEQVNIPIRHFFSPGVYAREIKIPAGTLLTGRVHLFSQLNILSGGEISVLTHEGMKRVKAPFTVVSPPGTKRIAYAHTECTWTTILATEETDPDKMEALFTVGTEQEFLEFVDAQKLIGCE